MVSCTVKTRDRDSRGARDFAAFSPQSVSQVTPMQYTRFAALCRSAPICAATSDGLLDGMCVRSTLHPTCVFLPTRWNSSCASRVLRQDFTVHLNSTDVRRLLNPCLGWQACHDMPHSLDSRPRDFHVCVELPSISISELVKKKAIQ